MDSFVSETFNDWTLSDKDTPGLQENPRIKSVPRNFKRNNKNEVNKWKRIRFKARRYVVKSKKINQRRVNFDVNVEGTNYNGWSVCDQHEISGDLLPTPIESKDFNVLPLERNNLRNQHQKCQLGVQTSAELSSGSVQHAKRVQKKNTASEPIRPCIVLLKRIPEDEMDVLLARANAVPIKNNNSSTFLENCKVCACSSACSSISTSFCADFISFNENTSLHSSRKLCGSSAFKNRSASPFKPANSSSPVVSNSFLSEPRNNSGPISVEGFKDGDATYDIAFAVKEYDFKTTREVSTMPSNSLNESDHKISSAPLNFTYELNGKAKTPIASASTENYNTTFEVHQPNLLRDFSEKDHFSTTVAVHNDRAQIKERKATLCCTLQKGNQSLTPLIVQKRETLMTVSNSKKSSINASEEQENIIDVNCIDLHKLRHHQRKSNVTFEKPSKPNDSKDSISSVWKSDNEKCSPANQTYDVCNMESQIDETTRNHEELLDTTEIPVRRVKFRAHAASLGERNTFNGSSPATTLKNKKFGILSKKRKITFSDKSLEQKHMNTTVSTNFFKGRENFVSPSTQSSIRFNMADPLCSSTTLTTPNYKEINQKQTLKKCSNTPMPVQQNNILPKLIKTPGPSRTPLICHFQQNKPNHPPLLKAEVVKPSTSKRTKMPDFTSIHKKMFDKMLNIEEYSRRKSERAQLLLSGRKPSRTEASLKKCNGILSNVKPALSKKQLKYPNEPAKKSTTTILSNPTKVGNCEQTRFGMLQNGIPRKEQMKVAIKKVRATKVTTAENRTEIKGVRSNRRFELLMKMRQNKG